ncbi:MULTISPECIES: ATP-grasp fold amidoligase family protein [Actinomycetes]
MPFDKTSKDSPYLRFLNREFGKRGTQLRRRLSNKTEVHRQLKDLRVEGDPIGLPQQHRILESASEITAESLGERAALKFAHGWSARGVMLLERTGSVRYFDHLSLREMDLDEIRARQRKVTASFRQRKSRWIIEELLQGPQPGPLPFDYKFYMFQGQIGLISQIDRNSSPIRNAFFDGNFRPLEDGRDFKLCPSKVQPAPPLVPRTAVMLSRWAIELSRLTDAPFVRVDLYDTYAGPYFGEFTFSSGAEVKGTITFGNHLIEEFDRLLLRAERSLRGERVMHPDNWSTLIESTSDAILAVHPVLDTQQYEHLAYYLYNHGPRGGLRLAEAHDRLSDGNVDDAISTYLVRAHEATAHWVRKNRRPLPATFGSVLRQARQDHPSLDWLTARARRPARLLSRLSAPFSATPRNGRDPDT